MENAIKIQLPILVSYSAIEDLLKKKMFGEYIPPPEKGSKEAPYAQVLGIALEGSSSEDYDILLRIRISILRTVLKRDEVDVLVRAIVEYDNATQQLVVRKFKLDARTPSGFYNAALEVLANKVAYHQIIKKTRLNLQEVISKQLTKANGLLGSGLELKGLKLMGKVEMVRVKDISLLPDRITLLLELQGNLEADIFDLLSLMPPE